MQHTSPEWVEGFGKLWALLAAHPKARVAYADDDAMENAGAMYRTVLEDVELPELRAAVLQCLARCAWFPSPAEIRDAVAAMGDAEEFPTAIEGWEQVRTAMSWRGGTVTNPIAKRVCEAMGGVYSLRSSTKPQQDRTTFLIEYDKLAERERQKARVVPQARAALGLPAYGVRELPVAPARPALEPPPEERPLAPAEAVELIRRIRMHEPLDGESTPPVATMPLGRSLGYCNDCAAPLYVDAAICPRCAARDAAAEEARGGAA